MDVFEAIDSRIACRWFLDSPVDPTIVRELIEKAARAPSNGNLQPWNVHAVAGTPLSQIKRRAAEITKINEWDKLETEFPMAPENLWEPYLGRRVQHGAQLYGAMGNQLMLLLFGRWGRREMNPLGRCGVTQFAEANRRRWQAWRVEREGAGGGEAVEG